MAIFAFSKVAALVARRGRASRKLVLSLSVGGEIAVCRLSLERIFKSLNLKPLRQLLDQLGVQFERFKAHGSCDRVKFQDVNSSLPSFNQRDELLVLAKDLSEIGLRQLRFATSRDQQVNKVLMCAGENCFGHCRLTNLKPANLLYAIF